MIKQILARLRYWYRDQQDITHQELLERMRELKIGVKISNEPEKSVPS